MLQESERKSVLRMHDDGTTRKEIYFLLFISRLKPPHLALPSQRLDIVEREYTIAKTDVDAFLDNYATDSSRTQGR